MEAGAGIGGTGILAALARKYCGCCKKKEPPVEERVELAELEAPLNPDNDADGTEPA